jgi:ABC-2 type transport system ATP-binding protein
MANSPKSPNAVEAQDLVKVFPRGNVRALDGVSLAIEAGTVLGLLGPNGAGKTTAVRILSTILEPDGGSAAILGHDVCKEPDTVRRLIGLAGQYATVDENLTGRENIRMVGQLSHMRRKVAAARADQLLEAFGLADAGDRPLKTYSGGMRRRLDLAAALVAGPPVLFLDEPTTGLDPPGRQDLWGVIEELTAEGTTVLLTTQYLEEADRLARDIVVVDHGRVIAQGTPAELKADLGTSVVAVTLDGGDSVGRAIPLLAPLADKQPVVDGSIVELTVENGPAVGAEVLRALDAARIPVRGLALREPSLDDVFLSLTGEKAEAETDAERAAHTGGGRRRRGATATDTHGTPDTHGTSDTYGTPNTDGQPDFDGEPDFDGKPDTDGKDAA